MFLVKFATRLLTWKFNLGSTVSLEIPFKVKNICNFFCFSQIFCKFKVLQENVWEQEMFPVKFCTKYTTCNLV